MKRSRLLAVAVGVVASASALTVVPQSPFALAGTASAPAATTAGHAVVSAKVSAAAQAAAVKYWTPARMASAKSADTTRAGSPGAASNATARPNGPAGAVSGRAPAGASANVASHQSQAQPNAFTYPFPYDAFPADTTLIKQYPRSVNGKIFFTNNTHNYVCSGTSVVTPNSNEVWTAGHCTANTAASTSGGVFDSMAVFVPAFNGNASTGAGKAPFGEYVASQFVTWSSWLNNADFSHDIGAFTVNPSTGASGALGSRVGSAGFAWNQNVNQQFETFGYPADSPYNGKSQYEDIGATATSDTSVGAAGDNPTGIGSPLTGGSSGGAWFYGWSDNGTGWINGHNDYKYGSQPGAMYSPYFNTDVNTIRCFLQPAGC